MGDNTVRQPVPKRSRLFAKTLRTNQTDAEWRLWACLRAGRLEGLKFKRQVPLKGYVLDFVCFEARLIVELDGGQHAESVRDHIRDATFAGDGFLTMRVWNSEVMTDADAVAYQILLAAKARLST